MVGLSYFDSNVAAIRTDISKIGRGQENGPGSHLPIFPGTLPQKVVTLQGDYLY